MRLKMCLISGPSCYYCNPVMGRCSWGLFMEELLGVKAIPRLPEFDVVSARCCWMEPPMAKRTERVL